MPKEARRKSATRTEPYPTAGSPTIRPGDERKAAPAKVAAPKPRAKKALAEKTSSEINVPSAATSNDKPTSKTKKPKTASKQAAASKPTEEKDDSTQTADVKKPKAKTAPKKTAKSSFASEHNISSFLDIHLEGEDEGTIACYDTCSTLRQKINALLGKDNKKGENLNPQDVDKKGNKKPFTKASFSRAIGVSASVITSFLGAKQIMGGAESAAYPAAYAFFEKKRIFEGKKKTASRLKVEENRPYGLPFQDPRFIRLTLRYDENPADFLDEYGQVGGN